MSKIYKNKTYNFIKKINVIALIVFYSFMTSYGESSPTILHPTLLETPLHHAVSGNTTLDNPALHDSTTYDSAMKAILDIQNQTIEYLFKAKQIEYAHQRTQSFHKAHPNAQPNAQADSDCLSSDPEKNNSLTTNFQYINLDKEKINLVTAILHSQKLAEDGRIASLKLIEDGRISCQRITTSNLIKIKVIENTPTYVACLCALIFVGALAKKIR